MEQNQTEFLICAILHGESFGTKKKKEGRANLLGSSLYKNLRKNGTQNPVLSMETDCLCHHMKILQQHWCQHRSACWQSEAAVKGTLNNGALSFTQTRSVMEQFLLFQFSKLVLTWTPIWTPHLLSVSSAASLESVVKKVYFWSLHLDATSAN